MYTEDNKAFCDGCRRQIRGTEDNPANVWHMVDGEGESVHLCDRCAVLFCDDCGTSLYKDGVKYYQAGSNDAFYCDNGVCGPECEE